MSMKDSRKQQGTWGENLACAYLETQGLQLITQNYRCQQGEIDLIMQQQQTLVFVEVRSRRVTQYGSGAESVNLRKQQHLILSAQHYLQTLDNMPLCRFDVVAIMGTGQTATLDWIQNAFQT